MVKLLRQIIKYKYEKIYETNARNNRFFYQDFYVAYSLALIWLVKNMGYKADMDEIKFKNGLWLKYTTLSLRESLNSHDKGDKEYNNLVQDLYLKKRKIIDEDFQRMIAEDLHIINLFLNETKYIFDEGEDEDFEVKNIDRSDILAISNYEWDR